MTLSEKLPHQLTSFVGRKTDLTKVSQMLRDPACRLLTLLGPGGTGKTRLALEAARCQADHFPDGIFWVDLQSTETVDFLKTAIADALSLPGRNDPHRQLLSYLQDKTALLVLDNFEHLVDGAGLLNDILRTAPTVKFLVTSREVLNLREEWQFPVTGLAVPPSTQSADWQSFDAVQLLVERARQVRPEFSLAAEAEDAVRLCRLVAGLPLALELAASWLKTLTLAQIIAEIQRNLDVLTTTLRDVPERHRSMRAVFDASWQRLSPTEQDVFAKLSVFRGGFHREAASVVAGGTLPVLTALVDKSLLRWQPDDRRYQLHELLRQYAAAQLERAPDEAVQTRKLHCAIYADFLQRRSADITGRRQREILAEIEHDLDNIRAAWNWAAAHVQIDDLHKSSVTLGSFYQCQGRYQEGVTAFEKAAINLSNTAPQEQRDLALVSILVNLAWFRIRLGRLDEAEAALLECQDIYDRLGILPVLGFPSDPLLALSTIAGVKGEYALAWQRAEQVRQSSETQQHLMNRLTAYNFLAAAALGQGKYAEAQDYAQKAYDISARTERRWFMAYCLNELGNVAYALYDYEAARAQYEASYAIRREFNDPEGMALALIRLSEIAIAEENYAEARELGERSLSLYGRTGDRGGLAAALNILGLANVALGDYDTARQQLHQALELALEIQYVPCLLAICYSAGRLFLETDKTAWGLQLLALVQRQPHASRALREQVQRLFNRAKTHLAPDFLAASRAEEATDDLETSARRLLTALSTHIAGPAAVAPSASPSPQSLIEPLSERELEVLQLIAAGLKNREIAARLVLSLNTVKTHISNIYGKLGVANRVQAVARARDLNLIPK